MNKQGQFYLLAAIIIIGILIGFATITNYVQRNRENQEIIYDLGEELDFESAKVVEYGYTNLLDDNEMDNLLEHFTTLYSEYAGEGTDVVFVFGDVNHLKAYSYQDIEIGEIALEFDGEQLGLTISKKLKKEFAPEHDEEKIKVKLDKFEYDFKLEKGQNFYFVITQEIGGETYSVS